MASCNPTPTLTVFSFVTSTATTTTLAMQTQSDGSVSTVTLPQIITSIITFVYPASTLYGGCSSSFSLISRSSLPVTNTRTTTHTPSTPTESIVIVVPKSQTSKTAPILGGVLGGFIFIIIGIVAITRFIRKKGRKSNAVMEEKDIVIPYPVTRARDQSKQLDLANESGLGLSNWMTGPGSSPSEVMTGGLIHQLP